MKRIYILICVLLGMSSCKDFLEPESLSTFNTNYIYSNVEDARKGVNAAYVSFSTDGFRSRLSNNMTGNTDIERQSGWGATADRHQIWNLDALPGNGDLRQFWNAAYTSIRDCNIAIEGIEESKLLASNDVAGKRQLYHMLGEVYTIRAYWYSMLTYYFGDVPNVRLAPKAGQDFYLSREDRNLILSQQIEDMIKVESQMLWADQINFGIEQVSREYTLGMIARLALQRGGYYLTPELTMERKTDFKDYYEIARTYTEKLITLKDRELPADYRQVFMNQNKFISPVNSDVLFEVPFALGSGDVAWNIGITVDGGTTASHSYGSGNNYMSIPPNYYFSFDSTDIRRDVTCALYKVNTSFQKVFVSGVNNIAQGKWSRHFLTTPPGPSTAKGTGINWPMLRYSDVLLMYAEAENEISGPTEKAREALSRVRRRAFPQAQWPAKVDQYVAGNSGSKDAFFTSIVNERGWEFGGEMIRKYELIRWNLYAKKMQETANELKQMADDAFNVTGKYAQYPDYMYWRRNSSGEFEVLNPNRKFIGLPDESWTRVPFLIALHNNLTTYAEWITKDWANHYNGPQPGVARYVFPIPSEAITNSQGKLDNKGYRFQ